MQCEQSTILRQLKFGRDTPSLIDVKASVVRRSSLADGRISDSGRRRRRQFFAGVIKESELMLGWAAEQPTEIMTTAIGLEFLLTDTNEDRGVQNLEFVLQQMHTAPMALTSYEANDMVANSRKNPLDAWRRLQKRHDPTTGGRKRNLLRDHFSWTVLSSGTPSGE